MNGPSIRGGNFYLSWLGSMPPIDQINNQCQVGGKYPSDREVVVGSGLAKVGRDDGTLGLRLRV